MKNDYRQFLAKRGYEVKKGFLSINTGPYTILKTIKDIDIIDASGELKTLIGRRMKIAICEDMVAVYDSPIFGTPKDIWTIPISDILWDEFVLDKELAYIDFKYKEDEGIGFLRIFLDFYYKRNEEVEGFFRILTSRAPELIEYPGDIKNEKNEKTIIFKKRDGDIAVRFDYDNEIFKIYSQKDFISRNFELMGEALFSELLNCELIEDNNSIIKGGLISAVGGGIVFGGIGAIVGSNVGSKSSDVVLGNALIKLTLNRISNPIINFCLYEAKNSLKKIYKLSPEYKTWLAPVDDLIGTFYGILNKNQQNKQNFNNGGKVFSGADEIMKYKELLCSGIITQDEFEQAKKKVLAQ